MFSLFSRIERLSPRESADKVFGPKRKKVTRGRIQLGSEYWIGRDVGRKRFRPNSLRLRVGNGPPRTQTSKSFMQRSMPER